MNKANKTFSLTAWSINNTFDNELSFIIMEF